MGTAEEGGRRGGGRGGVGLTKGAMGISPYGVRQPLSLRTESGGEHSIVDLVTRRTHTRSRWVVPTLGTAQRASAVEEAMARRGRKRAQSSVRAETGIGLMCLSEASTAMLDAVPICRASRKKWMVLEKGPFQLLGSVKPRFPGRALHAGIHCNVLHGRP